MSVKDIVESGSVKLEPHTVESITELVDTFGLLMTFLNDQAIQDLSGIFSQLMKLVNGLASTDLVDVLERGLMDPELDKALVNPPSVGLFGLMRALGDEDTKKGMGILLTLVKTIGRASTS